MKQAISNAGIVQNPDGTQEIPASTRGDGTTRAPIRVRPGYIPTEDITKYRPPRTRPTAPMSPTPRTKVEKTETKSDRLPAKLTPPNLSTEAKSTQDSPARQQKTSWADSGWRGSDQAPSRWARPSDSKVDTDRIPTLAPENTMVGARAEDLATDTTAHIEAALETLDTIASQDDHSEQTSTTAPGFENLADELNKVKLSETASKIRKS